MAAAGQASERAAARLSDLYAVFIAGLGDRAADPVGESGAPVGQRALSRDRLSYYLSLTPRPEP